MNSAKKPKSTLKYYPLIAGRFGTFEYRRTRIGLIELPTFLWKFASIGWLHGRKMRGKLT